MYFEQQGRLEQASLLMEETIAVMEGQAFPENTIGRFLLDFARIAAGEDLCHFPKHRKALAFLRQAAAYFPEDSPEIMALSSRIRQNHEKALLRYRNAFISPQAKKDPVIGFWEVVMNVERLLTTQRLDLALSELWFGLLAFAKEMPDKRRAVPHLAWLLSIIPKTVYAQDEDIKETSQVILESMAANIPFLQTMGLPLPLDFVALLEKEGVSFVSSPRETC